MNESSQKKIITRTRAQTAGSAISYHITSLLVPFFDSIWVRQFITVIIITHLHSVYRPADPFANSGWPLKRC